MAGLLGRLVSRRITTAVNLSAAEGPSATAGHAGGMDLWRKLSFFVAIPAVLLCAVHTYLRDQAHPHEPPEFVPYEHLRKREKRFPWGDGTKTLFHNPHTNPLPDGYESHH
ncbi:cytochrome c oxidase subunit 6A, mitochondrial-like [Ischnura elegans]|uniref:cytochrome c oxidase subunit 6A, mitochondrial-like n=1 Tax=Ischnura elegans TaxID=197161 RepID=UPI001ED8916D|nr:cytochrome c oxidase subunit 6A, mitochondrial-like [Ischnura elegans]